VGEGMDLPIVTQGKTIDETVKNLEEAFKLYMESENLADFGISDNPSALVNFELAQNA
jgi:predicted RNase H-like HicB family nuclease